MLINNYSLSFVVKKKYARVCVQIEESSASRVRLLQCISRAMI